MSQIKKYAAVGGAVCLVACWPLVVGQITQNAFDREMSAFSNQWVEGKTLTYDRGYLSTQVEVEMTVVDPELKSNLQADGFPVSLIWRSDIRHGIFSVDAETTLKNYPDFPLVIKTSTSLVGNSDFTTTLGKMDYHGKNDETSWALTSDEAVLNGHARATGEVNYQYQIPSFVMNFASEEKLSFEHVSGNGEGKKEGYFWLGKQHLNTEKVTFEDVLSGNQVELNQFNFESGLSQNADASRMSMNQVVKTAAITSPMGNLTGLEMDFSIVNLDKASVTKIVSAADKAKSSEAVQISQAEMIDALNQLVKQGFSVILDRLNIGLDDGQVQTSMKLTLPEGIESVTMNPQQLLHKLEGEIHATVPVSLIDKDPDLRRGIDELIVMEMVQQKGDVYVTNTTIKDGNLIFESGEKMPLASSLMMLMYLSR
ncbi:hypothetical protein VA7868_01296 [Vibrio aerogenes CECT 7868]|uniref:DUF945 domain-containing protein n=1 Tax=Vibrio aerogenes CECT 7868 TaxID=1216006 RepID=A0A1M5XTI2_9VIBR|nr:DUF945 family protein [Vibrio aerogenes]SHI02828.1 hypothetical protein VA7868_01296 [Vibrio aerogenes CECT 7868]